MPKLAPREKRKVTTDIRRLQGKGYTDEEIMDELDLRAHAYAQHKREILQADKLAFQNMDSSSVYSDYVAKSRQMVKELDHIQLKFRNRGQWTALVAAIKTKSEIYDKVIKMGQDFGFIEKKAAEMKVTGEVSFNTMSDEDMRKEIQMEVQALHQMVKGKVINMRPELLGVTDAEVKKYLPASVQEEPQEQRSKIKKKIKLKVSLRKNV